MNPVLRGFAIYIFLLVVFRLMGKRSLKETTTFDFLLILIISEVTQQALVGQDYSITGAFILILTLIAADLLFTFLREALSIVDQVMEGAPLLIVDHGQPLERRMKKCKVEKDDVLHAARLIHGIETMLQIKYAVLEKDGSISIIPY
jgi:Predicted membrane protein